MATWNIEGLRNKQKEVLNEITKHNIDITVLIETKKKGNGSEEVEDFIYLYSGVNKEQRAKAEISILIKKNWLDP